MYLSNFLISWSHRIDYDYPEVLYPGVIPGLGYTPVANFLNSWAWKGTKFQKQMKAVVIKSSNYSSGRIITINEIIIKSRTNHIFSTSHIPDAWNNMEPNAWDTQTALDFSISQRALIPRNW